MNNKSNYDRKNQDLQVDQISEDLVGKRIGIGVTGGIAAIVTPIIARQFRRHGAEVTCYATENAFKFIGEASLEWATERAVVRGLSGLAEHICQEDMVVVAPATLNTINKIYQGIADNPVTTLVASALGSKIPVYIAPCMHMSLYDNPIFKKNLEDISKYGVKTIEPRFGENKAKIARTSKIVNTVKDYLVEANK